MKQGPTFESLRLRDLLVVLMPLIAGCATFDSAVMSAFESVGITPDYRRGQGLPKVLDAPYEDIWKAVPQAMTSLNFPYVDRRQSRSQPARGEVRAFQPRKEWWGKEHRVVIFVDPEGESRTRVEVISAHPMHPVERIKWLHHDWGPEVMQKIEQMLLQGKQEKPQQANPSPMGVQQSRRLP